MTSLDSEIQETIRNAVVDVLGNSRTKDLVVRPFVNADGEEITLIKVVYDAEQGLTVEEMDLIHQNIWSEDGSRLAPFPVIDFQEDSDTSGIAAE